MGEPDTFKSASLTFEPFFRLPIQREKDLPKELENHMNVKALLDVDMVAMEATDNLTLMLDLTAPVNPKHASRPGQAVQVVLDRSGSMNGQPLEAAKGSLLKLIDRLAPQDSFGLVAFDDTALVVVPTRTMADHHMPSLRKSIREMHTFRERS